MISLKHPFCNTALTPPLGMTEDECRTLHIYRELPTEEQPHHAVTSFWTPEPAELETLNSGGSVMLRILGHTHPPLSMRVSPHHEGAVPAGNFVPFVTTTDEFNAIAEEVIKLREQLKNWQTVESVHINGEGDPATPESVIDHLKYLQDEWDTAEKRIAKLDSVLEWHRKFSLRVLTLLFDKDHQGETLESIRTLVAAEMPEREDAASISEWLAQRAAGESAKVIHESPIHEFFGLSYCSYLVLPRSLLQSCTFTTQQALCDALELVYQEEEANMPHHWPHEATIKVTLKDCATGRCIKDDLADYDRGRRTLW